MIRAASQCELHSFPYFYVSLRQKVHVVHAVLFICTLIVTLEQLVHLYKCWTLPKSIIIGLNKNGEKKKIAGQKMKITAVSSKCTMNALYACTALICHGRFFPSQNLTTRGHRNKARGRRAPLLLPRSV